MTIEIHRNGMLFTVSALGHTTSEDNLNHGLDELIKRLYKDRARLCGLEDRDLTDEARSRRDQLVTVLGRPKVTEL